tara:strand:+ start:197833 stop:198333 length:501 start_codon:yes stop_codon:yes gene_type:complete
MGWIKTFGRKDGGYDSFNWRLSDSFAVMGVTILFWIFLILFASLIVPFFMLLFYAWTVDYQRKPQTIVGIVACLFWLADFHFGGFHYDLGTIYPSTYMVISTLNLIMLPIFICLLIFDKSIFEALHSLKFPVILSWLIFGLVLYFFYPMFEDILNTIGMASKPIWT